MKSINPKLCRMSDTKKNTSNSNKKNTQMSSNNNQYNTGTSYTYGGSTMVYSGTSAPTTTSSLSSSQYTQVRIRTSQPPPSSSKS